MTDDALQQDDTRSHGKSATAFRTIGEAATELGVPQHVLRFWETRFSQIRPLKRIGGRRYYRPADLQLLRGIRELLYTDGYTIKGVQKLLRTAGTKAVVLDRGSAGGQPATLTADAGPDGSASGPTPAGQLSEETQQALRSIRSELEDLRDLIANPHRGS